MAMFLYVPVSSGEKRIPVMAIGKYFLDKRILPSEFNANIGTFTSIYCKAANSHIPYYYTDESFVIPEKFNKHVIDPMDVEGGMQLLKAINNQRLFIELLKFDPNSIEITEGDKFPEFSAHDINGETICLSDCKDRVFVINQWYTGCGPCKKEMPELSEWKNEFPDVIFLSVCFQDRETVKELTDEKGFNWRHICDDRQMVKWLRGKGFPMTIVVDKNGIIRKSVNGTSSEIRNNLKQTIKDCL